MSANAKARMMVLFRAVVEDTLPPFPRGGAMPPRVCVTSVSRLALTSFTGSVDHLSAPSKTTLGHVRAEGLCRVHPNGCALRHTSSQETTRGRGGGEDRYVPSSASYWRRNA